MGPFVDENSADLARGLQLAVIVHVVPTFGSPSRCRLVRRYLASLAAVVLVLEPGEQPIRTESTLPQSRKMTLLNKPE